MTRLTTCFVLLLTFSGCTRYEFDLMKPEDQSRHIASAADEIATIDPLEYRLRAVDNRLVLRIYNNTPDPIELLGPQSSAVDGAGQSHPLRGQTMAPSSFIKLILPPMRPTVERVGPTFGVGFGVRAEADHFPYDEPRYYTVYDEGNEYFWDWNGETDVRLNLVFQRDGKTFRHDFMFHRKKM